MAILKQSREDTARRIKSDDLKKFEFEQKLIPRLNGLFREISADFKDIYTATGQAQTMSIYRDDLNSILKSSNRQTSRWFRDNLKRELELNVERQEGKSGEEFALLLLDERNKIESNLISMGLSANVIRVNNQTTSILSTTNEVIEKNVLKVILEAGAVGVTLTNSQIASIASPLITKENINRSAIIADTEIQQVAEGAKQLESGLYQQQLINDGIVDENGQVPVLEKTWIIQPSLSGGNVRDSHRQANGQKRKQNEAFVVQGQRLMFPGDSSLGASLDNIIHCNCISLIA